MSEEELINLFDYLIEKEYWCTKCSPKSCLHITKEELLKEIKGLSKSEEGQEK